jgi:hypothetical protein
MTWTELDTAIAWHIEVTKRHNWTSWLGECLTCRKPVAGNEASVWGWAIWHVENEHMAVHNA